MVNAHAQLLGVGRLRRLSRPGQRRSGVVSALPTWPGSETYHSVERLLDAGSRALRSLGTTDTSVPTSAASATMTASTHGPWKTANATPPKASSADQKYSKQHGAPVAVAELEQSVVQVLLVRRERRRAAAHPADDREQQVDERHDQHRQRDDQRQAERAASRARSGTPAGRLPVAGGRRRGGQHQPDQHRAGVTHEDPGREEVVRQEAEAGAGQRRRQQRGRRGDVEEARLRRGGRRRRRTRRAMAVTPAARPSRPSMKLIALIVRTVSRMVTGMARSRPEADRSVAPGQVDIGELHAAERDHHAGRQPPGRPTS